jgi:hypothetical protein
MLWRRLAELVTSIEAAFVKHLSGGLVRVEWLKHTLRVIKLC